MKRFFNQRNQIHVRPAQFSLENWKKIHGDLGPKGEYTNFCQIPTTFDQIAKAQKVLDLLRISPIPIWWPLNLWQRGLTFLESDENWYTLTFWSDFTKKWADLLCRPPEFFFGKNAQTPLRSLWPKGEWTPVSSTIRAYLTTLRAPKLAILKGLDSSR